MGGSGLCRGRREGVTERVLEPAGLEPSTVQLCGWIYTFLNLQNQDGFFKPSFPGVNGNVSLPPNCAARQCPPEDGAESCALPFTARSTSSKARASRLRNLNRTCVDASFPLVDLAPGRPGPCAAPALQTSDADVHTPRAALPLAVLPLGFVLFTPTLCLGDCPTPANTELACSF